MDEKLQGEARLTDAHHQGHAAPTEGVATKTLATSSHRLLVPGPQKARWVSGLNWPGAVNSESLVLRTNLTATGRDKDLFVAALGLFPKMIFRPDFQKYIMGCI